MNEFDDDVEQLEREFGPALRLALRRAAAAVPSPGSVVGDLDGQHFGDIDERDAATMWADDAGRGRHPRRRWMLVAAATTVVIGVGLVSLTEVRDPDRVDTNRVPPTPTPSTNEATTPPPTTVESPPTTLPANTTAPAPATNGWVAGGSNGDIYLVRPGEDARRLEVAGSDTADEACPAWSPDGTRLLFGRLTGSSDTALSDAELVIVPVGLDGTAGAPTVIALDGFDVLAGFDAHPCGAWAPDGRWIALAGTGDVWVVDTQTGAIRRLPDLRPSDLEWRPGTDQLAIAGDMGPTRNYPTLSTPVSVYSVSTGELHQLGSVEAAHLTWSPDGLTLAYTGGEDIEYRLGLVDADGANERVLVANPGPGSVHGIGPVWSPTGDRIAYQRSIGCCESSEVVLVNVADANQTVIAPPQTDGPNGPETWYPFHVTWSPDGTTLLYTAWSQGPTAGSGSAIGVIAVPADTPSDLTELTDEISEGSTASHQWVPIQMWGRQPG